VIIFTCSLESWKLSVETGTSLHEFLHHISIYRALWISLTRGSKGRISKSDFNNYLVDADIDSLVNKLVSINIDQVHNAVINSLVDECNTIILGAASICNLLHEKNMSMQTVNNCNKQKGWINHGLTKIVV
jgi:hypothetical protein